MRTTEHIENRVAQIISTDKRKEILSVIISRPHEFTVAEVYDALKDKSVDIKITSVLNVIKTLHYAGFLSETPETNRDRKNRRPKHFYRIVSGVTAGRSGMVTPASAAE